MNVARSYIVRGRVQGVGFRQFVSTWARKLGIKGFVRNASDGSVEVSAVGSPRAVADLAGILHKGPPLSEVRSVEEREAPMQHYESFDIET